MSPWGARLTFSALQGWVAPVCGEILGLRLFRLGTTYIRRQRRVVATAPATKQQQGQERRQEVVPYRLPVVLGSKVPIVGEALNWECETVAFVTSMHELQQPR